MDPIKPTLHTLGLAPDTVFPRMNTKTTNAVVTYLLTNVAKVLLSATPDHHVASRAAEEARTRLIGSHTAEELKPIFAMKEVMIQAATKLAKSATVDDIRACYDYFRDLNEGRVYIMEDVADPEAYGLKRNS